MKRAISILMIVLCATIGLSVISATQAAAGGHHHHGHHSNWGWGYEVDFVPVHHHSVHCGHGYFDEDGDFHLYGYYDDDDDDDAIVELNLGSLFFGHN